MTTAEKHRLAIILGILGGLLLFWLVGCATAPAPIVYSDITDQVGNRYPVECVGQFHDLNVDVIPLSHERMQEMLPIYLAGVTLRGRWVENEGNDGIIFLDADLSPELLSDALHHELCHAYMNKHYGSSVWHQ